MYNDAIFLLFSPSVHFGVHWVVECAGENQAIRSVRSSLQCAHQNKDAAFYFCIKSSSLLLNLLRGTQRTKYFITKKQKERCEGQFIPKPVTFLPVYLIILRLCKRKRNIAQRSKEAGEWDGIGR
jgi:hypothetical protein